MLIHFETTHKCIYKTNSKLNLAEYLLRRKLDIKPKKDYWLNLWNLWYNRSDITLRPMSADLRNEFGHFEADSIEGIRAKNVIVTVIITASVTIVVLITTKNNNKQKDTAI